MNKSEKMHDEILKQLKRIEEKMDQHIENSENKQTIKKIWEEIRKEVDGLGKVLRLKKDTPMNKLEKVTGTYEESNTEQFSKIMNEWLEKIKKTISEGYQRVENSLSAKMEDKTLLDKFSEIAESIKAVIKQAAQKLGFSEKPEGMHNKIGTEQPKPVVIDTKKIFSQEARTDISNREFGQKDKQSAQKGKKGGSA